MRSVTLPTGRFMAYHRAVQGLAVAWPLGLAACATGPGISPFPGHPDVWVLRREAPARYPMANGLQASAFKEAGEHCAARQGEAEVIDVQSSQGWGVAGNYPTVLVRFRCVPAAARPADLPAAPATPAVAAPAAAPPATATPVPPSASAPVRPASAEPVTPPASASGSPTRGKAAGKAARPAQRAASASAR